MSVKQINILIFLFLLLFCVVFFGMIVKNGIAANNHDNKFKQACAEAGGIPYTPKGTKGWPRYICFDKDALIDIEVPDERNN